MPTDSKSALQALGTPAFPRAFGSKYVLLKEIGAGGMGRVFMALSGAAGMQRVCAIKTISFRDDGVEAEQLSRRFIDEARVVTRFEHQNLIYVFDAGLEGGDPYIAMEFVRGKPLDAVIDRISEGGGTLPLGLAMHIALELTAALGYVHDFGEQGLVHRDVSPANVMLSYAGAVKLIDFGVAKWRDRTTRTAFGLQWGKHGYRAPEQVLGSAIDRRADIFAAGVVFWEMLTGRRLFPDGQERPLRPEIPAPSTINPKVPPELDAVVLKAAHPDPGARYQTATELHAALARYLAPGNQAEKIAALLKQTFAYEVDAEAAEEKSLAAAATAMPAGELPVGPLPARVLSTQLQGAPSALASGAPPGGDPLLGTILGERYEVLRLIGRGGMGAVYEAYHRGIARRVALKIANRNDKDAELVRRLMIEAVAAGRLEHPNVARVTDSGTTPAGAFFFVMEYLDGVGLDRLIQSEAPMPAARALRIADQICSAVAAAHHAGIVHRDLKPSNVMLVAGDTDEQVKVLDFGLAKILHPHGIEGLAAGLAITRPEIAMGTPRYMAPEQIITGAQVDGRADLYSIAALLYEMLTGHAPHEGDDPVELTRRKIEKPPADPRQWRPDLPIPLIELLLRTLSVDPVKRPQSAAELQEALSVCLPRKKRPNPRAWIALGGASLGLLVATTMIWPLISPPHTPQPAPPQAARAAAQPAPHPMASQPAPAPLPPSPPPPTTQPAPTPPAPVRSAPRPPAPPAPVAKPAPVKLPATPAAPGDVATHMAKARDLFRSDNLADSLAETHEAVRLGGGVKAYVLLGSIHLRRGDYADAERAYESALKLDPNNETAQRGLTMSRQHR